MVLIKGYITGDDLMAIRDLFYKLVVEFSPHLLAMCESLTVVRNSINSVTSQPDGKVYERLYNYASNTRMNNKGQLQYHFDNYTICLRVFCL